MFYVERKKYIAACWSHYIFVYFLQHLSHDLTNREIVTSKLCTAITKTLKHFFFFLMVWCWVAKTQIPQKASYNIQERLFVFQDLLQKYLFENRGMSLRVKCSLLLLAKPYKRKILSKNKPTSRQSGMKLSSGDKDIL